MKPHNYFVYIITNKNKTVLYTGVTSDLKANLYKYTTRERKGFAYKYHCQYLIYYESFNYIDKAIQREKQIKGLTRKKKEVLINSFNPGWEFLNNKFQ